MAEILNDDALKKINKFTRRELNADEVYCFSVVLCDNEIDRDNERFSIEALNKLSCLFIGKTGIFDHNPKGTNQTARIFDTELVSDITKSTAAGEPYTYLKGTAYMVKTSANSDLIAEIDGGIKKEVSVSCQIERHLCSICNADTKQKSCSHKKGRFYNGQKCHIVLDNATDAYEWSFVAVPAQINAGVTKQYSENGIDENETFVLKSKLDQLRNKALEHQEEIEALRDCLKRDIVRLSFLCHPEAASQTVIRIAEGMSIEELISMKNQLEATSKSFYKPQTYINSYKNADEYKNFKL